jgi:hypothetical protein
LHNSDATARDIENAFVTETAPHPPASRVPPFPRSAGRWPG